MFLLISSTCPVLGDATKYVEMIDFQSFKCGLCEKIFSVKSNCTRHVKINHLGVIRDEDTKGPCPHCQKLLVKRTIPQHIKSSCPTAHSSQHF